MKLKNPEINGIPIVQKKTPKSMLKEMSVYLQQTWSLNTRETDF